LKNLVDSVRYVYPRTNQTGTIEVRYNDTTNSASLQDRNDQRPDYLPCTISIIGGVRYGVEVAMISRQILTQAR
jgi:hypothetical protein